MKKGIRFFAMIIMLLMLGVTFRIVSAAETAVLYMRANVSYHTVVEASCEVRYTGKLTNGKIRILYDTEKLKLEESRVGERAESFLYEINDSIQGTKEEGELVFAFASKEPQAVNGSLIYLKFSKKANTVLDSNALTVHAEEMDVDGKNITTRVLSTQIEQETPDTETETPDTETETPDTETETPATETETPDTETETPATETETPDTETETPDTETETPDTETETPDTETETPDTETETPNTETETPDTETETPDTETETPDTETETPDTETETPDTETETPDTETETPDTETPDTETETPDTKTETTDTETEAPDTGTKIPDSKITDIGKVKIAKIKNQVYTAKKIRPEVDLEYKGVVLQEGRDYGLSYSNNKKPGKAEIAIYGRGAFEGMCKTYFYIVPARPVLRSAYISGKRVVGLSWKKVKQADGYEIQIAGNKRFTGSVRRITVKKVSKTSGKWKVKGKKQYYVRIRAYKMIEGRRYRGAYSRKKRIRAAG